MGGALKLPQALPGAVSPYSAEALQGAQERSIAALELALSMAEQELDRLRADQLACQAAKERWLGITELRACVGTIRQAADGLAALRPRKPRG